MCWRWGADLLYISHHGIALIVLAAAMTDGVASKQQSLRCISSNSAIGAAAALAWSVLVHFST